MAPATSADAADLALAKAELQQATGQLLSWQQAAVELAAGVSNIVAGAPGLGLPAADSVVVGSTHSGVQLIKQSVTALKIVLVRACCKQH